MRVSFAKSSYQILLQQIFDSPFFGELYSSSQKGFKRLILNLELAVHFTRLFEYNAIEN